MLVVGYWMLAQCATFYAPLKRTAGVAVHSGLLSIVFGIGKITTDLGLMSEILVLRRNM